MAAALILGFDLFSAVSHRGPFTLASAVACDHPAHPCSLPNTLKHANIKYKVIRSHASGSPRVRVRWADFFIPVCHQLSSFRFVTRGSLHGSICFNLLLVLPFGMFDAPSALSPFTKTGSTKVLYKALPRCVVERSISSVNNRMGKKPPTEIRSVRFSFTK